MNSVMAAERDTGQRTEVEERVRELVGVIASLPGLRIIGSCGGHSRPAGDELPATEFYVGFDAAPAPEAWSSIEVIARCAHVHLRDRVWLIALSTCQGRLSFNLWGDADEPDTVAAAIRRERGAA